MSFWHALLKQFTRVWVWEKSSQINGHTLWGLNRVKHKGLFVSSTAILGTHWWGPIVIVLFVEVWIRKEGFASGIHTCPLKLLNWVCIVQHLPKRTWIRATLVVLIRLRMWTILKITMDYCSLEELITLQYGSFTALSEWVKQLTQRTGHSKHLTKWALRWQLDLDELDQGHIGWSVACW